MPDLWWNFTPWLVDWLGIMCSRWRHQAPNTWFGLEWSVEDNDRVFVGCVLSTNSTKLVSCTNLLNFCIWIELQSWQNFRSRLQFAPFKKIKSQMVVASDFRFEGYWDWLGVTIVVEDFYECLKNTHCGYKFIVVLGKHAWGLKAFWNV